MRKVLGTLLLLAVAGSMTATFAARNERPVTVSPGSASGEAVVEGRCPTFHWGSKDQTELYELVVYRVAAGDGPAEAPVLRVEIPGSVTGWTPSLGQCFEPGGRYAWSVRAEGRKGRAPWSAPSLFAIAEAPTLAEVEEALAVLGRYRSTGVGTEPEAQALPSRAAVVGTPDAADRATRTPDRTPERERLRARPRPGSPGQELSRAGTAAPIGAEPPTPKAAPTASTSPSLTVDDQIHLGSASDFFKDGTLILWSDTTNTALGREALSFNTTGFSNTATGSAALLYNTSGFSNTASGHSALRANTTGVSNTALGRSALLNNTTGDYNTAGGTGALYFNTTGDKNTASGFATLFYNTIGYSNTASGTRPSSPTRREHGIQPWVTRPSTATKTVPYTPQWAMERSSL